MGGHGTNLPPVSILDDAGPGRISPMSETLDVAVGWLSSEELPSPGSLRFQ